MAYISDSLTFARWLVARTSPIMDFSDDFLYSVLVGRGIDSDETLLSDVSEKQKDLCLADIYWAAAISSVKTGTQGESDGGWTHYVAIKNVVNRDALLGMAKQLYDKWGETYLDPTKKITMRPLY